MMVNAKQEKPGLNVAEAEFGFLDALGFTLTERFVSGGNSYRDGWRLVYAAAPVIVTVQYYDSQFEVHFARNGVLADFMLIDREMLARRSGFHGNMFPPEKLDSAIVLVAAEIREHFRAVLKGDEDEWVRIKRVVDAPTVKRGLP